MITWVDTQQRESRHERTRESSFNQAEAVLDAQVFQLGQAWPAAYSATATPARCTSASAAGSYCPQQGAITAGYTTADYTAGTCAGQQTWTTQVQDNVAGATQYYDDGVLNGATPAPSYDANGDGTVWVRASASPQCHRQTIVTLVQRVLAPLNFPRNVLTANWFQTGNTGNKVIVDTLGAHAQQRADVVARCAGNPTPALTPAQCTKYSPGQVSPDSTLRSSTSSAASLGATQLANLRQQAISAGTYYAAGTCPPAGPISSASTGIWAGAPVYVEGNCALAPTGTSNSDTSPGVLILASGTVSLGANNRFYGLIYALNQTANGYTARAYPSPVVSLSGCGVVQGAIVVDGLGGADLGACKNNLVYDPRAFDKLRSFAGAAIVKNAWRVLPG
jgi:hypothetical protein